MSTMHLATDGAAEHTRNDRVLSWMVNVTPGAAPMVLQNTYLAQTCWSMKEKNGHGIDMS